MSLKLDLKKKIEIYESISGRGMMASGLLLALAIMLPFPIVSPFLVCGSVAMYLLSTFSLFVICYLSHKLWDLSVKNVDFKEQIFHLQNYVFGYFKGDMFYYPKILTWGFVWEKIKVRDGFFTPFQKEVISVSEGNVIAKLADKNIANTLGVEVYSQKEDKNINLDLDFNGIYSMPFDKQVSITEWFNNNEFCILYKGIIYKLKK